MPTILSSFNNTSQVLEENQTFTGQAETCRLIKEIAINLATDATTTINVYQSLNGVNYEIVKVFQDLNNVTWNKIQVKGNHFYITATATEGGQSFIRLNTFLIS